MILKLTTKTFHIYGCFISGSQLPTTISILILPSLVNVFFIINCFFFQHMNGIYFLYSNRPSCLPAYERYAHMDISCIVIFFVNPIQTFRLCRRNHSYYRLNKIQRKKWGKKGTHAYKSGSAAQGSYRFILSCSRTVWVCMRTSQWMRAYVMQLSVCVCEKGVCVYPCRNERVCRTVNAIASRHGSRSYQTSHTLLK